MGYRTLEISFSFEGHARQSKLMHAQVSISSDIYLELWLQKNIFQTIMMG